MEGEFDDRVDPRFPVFSAGNLAEALPGPLTPITLDVQLSGLRTANRVLGRVLALGGVVGDEWGNRAIAVFGHRPYVGVSVNMVAAAQLPGWDQDAVARNALVGRPHVGDPLPFGEPALAGGALGSSPKPSSRDDHWPCCAISSPTRGPTARPPKRNTSTPHSWRRCPTPVSKSEFSLLRDRIHQGWILTALWLIDTGVTAAALERSKVACSVPGVDMIVESTRVAAETAQLAAVLRADPPLCALAGEGNLASIRALSPTTAAAVDAAVARVAHRGPGDAELASQTYADDPTMLLRAAGEVAVAAAASTEPPPSTLSRRLATNARDSRELAYDTTLRFTHELRMTLRELGSRRVAADLIDVVEDVYYLKCDELVAMPGDARLRIKRRRAERERLQVQRPPDVIDGTWTPIEASAQ